MSGRKRTREKEERREHKKHKTSKQDLEKLEKQTKKLSQDVQKLKHVETFYEKPPPGYIKENEEKPEDCIPADPGNEDARNFLAHAPTKGLWMPLGKEVKVMQCWRCKRYGHRTGDRECPFFIKGNQKLEQFRVAHEDPMYDIIRENQRNEKETRYGIRAAAASRRQKNRGSGNISAVSAAPRERERERGREKHTTEWHTLSHTETTNIILGARLEAEVFSRRQGKHICVRPAFAGETAHFLSTGQVKDGLDEPPSEVETCTRKGVRQPDPH